MIVPSLHRKLTMQAKLDLDTLEMWDNIIEGDNSYQVSNKGRVKSCIGNRVIRNIKFMSHVPIHNNEKILKGWLSFDGYPYVNINGKHLRVHVLVATHFIPNPLNLPEVNHNDGDKTNNNDWNLEWVTHKQNMEHASRMGLMPNQSGSNNGNSKLNEYDVYHIKLMLNAKYSYKRIATIFGISKQLIATISQGRTWKNVKINNH